VAKYSTATTLGDSAAAVWKTIRDFGGIGRWLPLAKCELRGSGVGAVRTITTTEGAVLVERLERCDEGTRTLSYAITESPLPFQKYVATMQLRELGPDRCELTWSASYEPKGATEQDVNAILANVFSTGFDGLGKLHGGRR
jgi:hypothetical protein